MSDLLVYKGFNGTIEYSAEDNCLYGQIVFINDTVTYEGRSVDELTIAFQEAVDDYLEICSEVGKEPEKPFKGKFPGRIDPDLHKRASLRALQLKMSFNKFVEQAIEHELSYKN